jgi:DNA-binding MarR family transcriptional regulator
MSRAQLVTDEELLPLLEIIEEFRIFGKEVPGQVISTFFYVASHNPCLMIDLQRDLKLRSGSASRCTDWLSDINRLGKPGPNLVKKEPDPLNANRAIISLTAKGEQFVRSIKRILYGS